MIAYVDTSALLRLILREPDALGTLDALHLATALVWRDRAREPLVFATHDAGLALAARAFDIEVLGA